MFSNMKELLSAGVVDDKNYFNRWLFREEVIDQKICIMLERDYHGMRIDNYLRLFYSPDNNSLFYVRKENIKEGKLLDFGKNACSFGAFKHFINMFVDYKKTAIIDNLPGNPHNKIIHAALDELKDNQTGDLIFFSILFRGCKNTRIMFFPHNWNF